MHTYLCIMVMQQANPGTHNHKNDTIKSKKKYLEHNNYAANWNATSVLKLITFFKHLLNGRARLNEQV